MADAERDGKRVFHGPGPAPADLIVELDVDVAQEELASDRLWQAGATAVEIRQGGAKTTVAASFPTPAAARRVAADLGGEARVVEVDPTWRDVWREFAEPIPVAPGLTVAPAWRDVALPEGALVLRIDPGDCFGSGSHPSTRMLLGALARNPPGPGAQVLDVGCGSGILSVAAARLGALQVTALDIDPSAVVATRLNAEGNGVTSSIRASTTPLEQLDGRFDLVLVNVTAGVHGTIGPSVVAHAAPGARILLAGLLPGQWRHVRSAYRPARTLTRLWLEGWEGFELALHQAKDR